MKLRVCKDKEDIITSLVIDGEEIQFDYIRLINGLYDNDYIEEPIDFSDDIEQWERDEIQKLIEDINKAIIKDNTDENSSSSENPSESETTEDDENGDLPF